MKKFERIISYNKKYTIELEDSINLIMPKLIQAFTNIYGESHKDYIENTLRNIQYVFFIPEKLLTFFNNYSENTSHKEQYIMDYYLKYLSFLDFKSISIKDEELHDYIYKYYITKTDVDYKLFKEANLAHDLADDNPAFTFVYNYQTTSKVILLPLYIIDIKTLIHELNHALCVDAVGIYNDCIITPSLYKNVISEELINDYIAELVLEEYKNIGGIIPKGLKRFKIENNYEYNYYIIEYLFDCLSPLILESLISKRHNLFIRLVGQKNCTHMWQLINNLYKKGYNESKYIELLNLIDKIYQRVMNTDFIDYDSYYQELESLGYRVRKL